MDIPTELPQLITQIKTITLSFLECCLNMQMMHYVIKYPLLADISRTELSRTLMHIFGHFLSTSRKLWRQNSPHINISKSYVFI